MAVMEGSTFSVGSNERQTVGSSSPLGASGLDEGKKRGREGDEDSAAQRNGPREEESTRPQRSKFLVGTFKAWRNVRQRVKVQTDATASTAADVAELANAFEVMMQAQRGSSRPSSQDQMHDGPDSSTPGCSSASPPAASAVAAAASQQPANPSKPKCKVCKSMAPKDVVSCAHCLAGVCGSCLRECSMCQFSFCSLCTTLNYSKRDAEHVCLNCNSGQID